MTSEEKSSFDAYVEALNNKMQDCEGFSDFTDPPLYLKAEAYSILVKHANMDYEGFLRQAKPEELSTEYLKKCLLYLAALTKVEEWGYDIRKVLEEAKPQDIPGLKTGEIDNKAYQAVYEAIMDSPITYLLGLLEISERSAREKGTAYELLKKLRRLKERSPKSRASYSAQTADLEDRLELREEEGRYPPLH